MFKLLPVAILLFAFTAVDSAYAYAGTNPNIIRYYDIPNFRRGEEGDKYRYSRRRRETDGIQASGTGSTTTFDQRARTLREAKERMFQQGVEEREFTGERRNAPAYYERDNMRLEETSLRRIRSAEKQGGVRLRGVRSLRQLGNFTADEKAQQIRQYREAVKAAEMERYQMQYDDPEGCADLIGKRQALCWYNQRNR